MLYKETQQSLLDLLRHIMPDWDGSPVVLRRRQNPMESKAAKALFAIWRDEKNAAGENKLKRPAGCSLEDVKLMQREGLIKDIGKHLEVTSRGAEIIKTMILGDNKSSYEEDGSIIDLETAYANLKPQMKKKAKTASIDEALRFALRLKTKEIAWSDLPPEIKPIVEGILKTKMPTDRQARKDNHKSNWYRKLK